MKCLVGPIKRGDPVLQRAYTELFEPFAPWDMPEQIHLKAAQLRGHFGLGTPDALHLAGAQYRDYDAFGRMTTGWRRPRTGDKQYPEVGPAIDRSSLRR